MCTTCVALRLVGMLEIDILQAKLVTRNVLTDSRCEATVAVVGSLEIVIELLPGPALAVTQSEVCFFTFVRLVLRSAPGEDENSLM